MNTQAALSLATCPTCGYVDENAFASVKFAAMAKSSVALLVAVAFGGLRSSRNPGFLGVASVIGVVLTFYFYRKQSWRWLEVDQRVQFVDANTLLSTVSDTSLWKAALLWGDSLSESIVTFPLWGDLHLGLLSGGPQGPLWLDEADLGTTSRSDALKRALENLKNASASGFIEVERGVYRGQWHDQIAASRLAVPELFSTLSLSGEPVAFTPSEDSLLVAGSNDAAKLDRAFTLAEFDFARAQRDADSTAGPFTAHPWVLTPKGFEPWRVPEGHALHARIAALDAKLGRQCFRPSEAGMIQGSR